MTTPILVKDIMCTKVNIIDSKSTVQKALNDMQQKKTKILMVDKTHEYDEYGVVLMTDIAAKVIAKGRSLERVNAYEIMTKPAICVHPNMKVRYCARFLTQLNLSRCPVIDNEKIVGVISLTSIVLSGVKII